MPARSSAGYRQPAGNTTGGRMAGAPNAVLTRVNRTIIWNNVLLIFPHYRFLGSDARPHDSMLVRRGLSIRLAARAVLVRLAGRSPRYDARRPLLVAQDQRRHSQSPPHRPRPGDK